ncbi:MAG TPA: glycosyltransferase [Magnetospirillum sp.]|jgi:glycosyltransferase involved in cell wall biosynthesis|nr:glycosyltransferase [Magnetospirillum sp.]
MHITLVDVSIPFDGFTASARALGGAEKGFAALPGALARRGHTVAVFNRCRWSLFIEGAQWETLEGKKPLSTDVLIAFRKPSLLEFIRQAKRRILWTTAPVRQLERTGETLKDLKPLVLLSSQAQGAGWTPKGSQAAVMPPAVKSDFLADVATAPAVPPRAVVTTHPSHGMDWLLDLWLTRIRPVVPEAELHLYSMGLAKAEDGGEVEEALRPLAEKVLAAREHGVVIQRPGSDAMMAQAYREATVHLYPGHADDATAFTLMESQASGLPAVLRPLGAAPERVVNGRSAYVVPDDDAFANLATMLLGDAHVARSMGAEAKAHYRSRSWDAAAEALESALT